MKQTKNIKNTPKKTAADQKPVAKSVAAKKVITPVAAVSRTVPPAKAAAPVAPPPRRTVTTEVIAARAYTLWEKAGRPNGRDVEYWLQAESQLKQNTQAFAE